MPILTAILDVVLEEKTAFEAFKGFVLGVTGLAPYFNFLRALKTAPWEAIKHVIKRRIITQVMSLVPHSHHIVTIHNGIKGNFTLGELLHRKKNELIRRGVRQVFGEAGQMALNMYDLRKLRQRRLRNLNRHIGWLQKKIADLDAPFSANFVVVPQIHKRRLQYIRMMNDIRALRQNVMMWRKDQVRKNFYTRRLMTLNRRQIKLRNRAIDYGAFNVAEMLNQIYTDNDVHDDYTYRRNMAWLDLLRDELFRMSFSFPNVNRGGGTPTDEMVRHNRAKGRERLIRDRVGTFEPNKPQISRRKATVIDAGENDVSWEGDVSIGIHPPSTALSDAMFIPYSAENQSINPDMDINGMILIKFNKTPDKIYHYFNQALTKWRHMLDDAVPNYDNPSLSRGSWTLMGYKHLYKKPETGMSNTGRDIMMANKQIRHHSKHKKIRSISNLKNTLKIKGTPWWVS